VDDTAAAHALAMEKGRPARPISSRDRRNTLEEALEVAEEITGIRPPLLRPPAAVLRVMATAASASNAS